MLLAPRSEHAVSSRPSLRPGLYLLDSSEVKPDLFHIIFWPEDTTWQDGSISSVARNRVTFMRSVICYWGDRSLSFLSRYLTKLCDQLVCLISDEHSANLVWKDDQVNQPEDEEEPESFEAYDRLFTFSVEQTNEEKETAVAKEGFTVRINMISLHVPDVPKLRHHSIEGPPETNRTTIPDGVVQTVLGTHLVVGEISQALVHVQYLPEEMKVILVDESIRPVTLRNKLRSVVRYLK
jgi:hypothetical protein